MRKRRVLVYMNNGESIQNIADCLFNDVEVGLRIMDPAEFKYFS